MSRLRFDTSSPLERPAAAASGERASHVRFVRPATVLALWLLWLAFAGMVAAGAAEGVDKTAARAVTAGASEWLDTVARGGALVFGLAVVAALGAALALVLVAVRSWRVALAVVVALVLAGLAERGVRTVVVQPAAPSIRAAAFHRVERQPAAGGAVAVRAALPGVAQPDARHSFPSGHATLAGALLAGALAGLAPRRRLAAVAGLFLGALGVWSGWSELYRGMHLLSDVAGGLLLGAAVMLTCLAPFLSCDSAPPESPG